MHLTEEPINSHLYTSYARMFTVYNDMIVYSNGNRVTTGTGDEAVSTDYWQLVCFDLFTGEYIKTIDLTCDGEPVIGLMGCNSIGVDDYGHLWTASYFSGQSSAEAGIKIRVYWIKDFENGLCELVCGGIEWPSNEVSYAGRIDFADICGDITGVQADGVYGAVSSNSGGTGDPYAYRFVRKKGTNKWAPGMDGFASWTMDDGVQLCPSTAATFGDNGTLVWANGSSEIFYANGNSTYPTQYSCYDGTPDCIGHFEQADKACLPSGTGATGAYEFVIGDKMYLGYADCQSNNIPGGAMSKIARMGGTAERGTFDGMELMWQFPAEGTYNTLSTGGIRPHPMIPVTKVDANGKTGVYIASGNTNSFLAVYLIAEEGFIYSNNTAIKSLIFNIGTNYINLNEETPQLQLEYSARPSTATNQSVTWKSSDPTVATVDENGLVTGLKEGTTTITITSKADTSITTTCTVKVGYYATGIKLLYNGNEITDSIVIGLNEKLRVQAVAVPENASYTNILGQYEGSDAKDEISILDGSVVTVGETSTFTMYLVDERVADDNYLVTNSIEMINGTAIENIEISTTECKLKVDQTIQLEATFAPSYATRKTLAWSSSNPEVATVNENGTVMAIASGEAIIYAKATDGRGAMDQCQVTVTGQSTLPYRLTMEDATIRSGNNLNMPVTMVNEGAVVGFQCDVVLPDDVTLAKDDDGQLYIDLADRTANHYYIMRETNGVVRIIVISANNQEISGNDGVVFSLPLVVDGQKREAEVKLTNIHLSLVGDVNYDVEDATCNLNILSPNPPGDANGDRTVTITDFTTILSYILGDNPDNFVFEAADMDGNGYIYVNDATAVLTMLMNQGVEYVDPVSQPSPSESKLGMEKSTFDIDGNATTTLEINNASQYVAIQVDFSYPTGVSISDMTLAGGNASTHSLMWMDYGNGNARALVYSMSNATLTSDELLFISVNADEETTLNGAWLTAHNALANTVDGTVIDEVDMGSTTVYFNGATGVDDIFAGTLSIQVVGRTMVVKAPEATTVTVSDVLGRSYTIDVPSGESRYELPSAGLYLINNRKYVVK